MMMPPLHLFDRVGVEIEYMIVDRNSLAVRPIADQLFADVLGEIGSDVEGPTVTWSNELVAHVVELKTTEPALSVVQACQEFPAEIARINELLARRNACLLPGAMHPWMNPLTETTLWPHDGKEVYENFDRVFGCQGHGWSNLQSMHLNLPFSGDDEFARLHTAIRLLIPLIPALAASSPFQEGTITGWLDTRLKHYATNSRKIPEVAGDIVPELVLSEEQYHEQIFAPMFRAIAPHDPHEEMREEWLNARGAIARFGRGSIEIRVIDSQESPAADAIVGSAIVELVRLWTLSDSAEFERQRNAEQRGLVNLFRSTCELGENARVDDRNILHSLGLSRPMSASEAWLELAARLPVSVREPLEDLIKRRPLARRLLQSAGPNPSRAKLETIVRELLQTLSANSFYIPPSA